MDTFLSPVHTHCTQDDVFTQSHTETLWTNSFEILQQWTFLTPYRKPALINQTCFHRLSLPFLACMCRAGLVILNNLWGAVFFPPWELQFYQTYFVSSVHKGQSLLKQRKHKQNNSMISQFTSLLVKGTMSRIFLKNNIWTLNKNSTLSSLMTY